MSAPPLYADPNELRHAARFGRPHPSVRGRWAVVLVPTPSDIADTDRTGARPAHRGRSRPGRAGLETLPRSIGAAG